MARSIMPVITDVYLPMRMSYKSILLQSYRDNCQQLYDKQLSIILKSEARLLLEDWQTIEVCSGARVREPEKIKS